MFEFWIFVSGGSEVDDERDLAVTVLRAVENVFAKSLDMPVVVRNWDYREEPPELVPAGAYAARSLRAVDRSHAVVAILGPSIPTVTSQEIRRAIRQYSAGTTDRVWVFVAAATKGDRHRQFIARIKKQLKVQIVYQTFGDHVDLERKLFVAVLPLVIRKTLMEPAAAVGSAGGEFE